MYEEWRVIEEFPEYEVSNLGNVINGWKGTLLRQRPQQYGVPSVWFHRDGKQYCRSVPLLVAKAWLLPPEREDFISPIQLDGDRGNCCADNLMWRPRWFSICFHKERANPPFPNWGKRAIEVRETQEVFPRPFEASYRYGVLETDVFLATTNENPVFPQWFHYRLI